MMHLQGRVFTRLQQFSSLPTALQHEANSLADYLTQHHSEVFDKHHTLKLKSVYGVRTRELLFKIDEWLQHGHAHHVPGTTDATHASSFPGGGSHAPTAVPLQPNSGHVPHHVPGHSSPTTDKHHKHHLKNHVASPHATTLLDALVLKGFVTPYKEDKHVTGAQTVEGLSFKNKELLVPLSNHVTGPTDTNPTTTVWDLVDGAVFAGLVKRKAGLLEPLTHGKHVYAVVNARCKTLTLFKTDLAHKPIVQLEASGMNVAFDTTRFDHGVKVWTSVDKELLHAASQAESDALIHALLAVGATHDKRHFLDDGISPSELHHPAPAMLHNTNGVSAAPGHHGQHQGHHVGHHVDHPHHHDGHHGHHQKSPSFKDKMGNLFRKDEPAVASHHTAHHGGPGQQPGAMGKTHEGYAHNQPGYAP